MKWAIAVVIVLVMIYIIITALTFLGVTVAEVVKDLWEFISGNREDGEPEGKDDVHNRH